MPIVVEVDVYSGLPNPRVVLSSTDESELRDRLRALAPTDQALDRRRAIGGYAGIRLTDTNPDSGLVRRIRIRNGVVGDETTRGSDHGRALEASLLRIFGASAPGGVPWSIEQLDQRSAPMLIEGTDVLGSPAACEAAPRFPLSPSIWDQQVDVTNCYNYALDLPCGAWIRPGNITGVARCGEVVAAVASEVSRHLPGGFKAVCPLDSYLIVLCLVDPNSAGRGGFHLLRLDCSGIWSHKFGTDAVTNLDDTGQQMHDLSCARFSYRLVVCAAFEYDRRRSCAIPVV